MTTTREEQIVLLYALYECGRRPSKARATDFILRNKLMRDRESDSRVVATGETAVQNRIAYTRADLKANKELSMPQIGMWAITEKGIEKLEKVALRSLQWQKSTNEIDALLNDIQWERFSDEFLKRLKILGTKLKSLAETNSHL